MAAVLNLYIGFGLTATPEVRHVKFGTEIGHTHAYKFCI
jgi:hypothetical protein